MVSEGDEVLIIVRSGKKRVNSMKIEYVRGDCGFTFFLLLFPVYSSKPVVSLI